VTRANRRPQRHRRPPRGSPRDDEEQDGDPDVLELLGDIRDALLCVIRLQSCDACGGFGRTPDRGDDGSLRWIRCPCRVVGKQFVEDFE